MLLVVGLTAFSHSMKELAEIHQLTLDASRLVAQWSGNVSPAEIPQTPQLAQTIVKIEKHESCDLKQSAPAVELPWVNEETEPRAVAPRVPRQTRTARIDQRVITFPGEAEIAKLKKLQRIDIDAAELEVRIPNVPFAESGSLPSTEFPEFTFRAKSRKHNTFKINPRDREILLKTLNRSINLRSAS